MIAKDIKLKYKSTYLGFIWSLANPALNALVFYIAFKVIMRVRIDNYLLFLLAGLFPWQWFANSMNSSPAAFVGNANLIKKVSFPRCILPLSVVGNNGVHFLLTLPVYAFLLMAHGIWPSLWWLLGIPLLGFAQFTLSLGLSLMVSSLNVYFRDLEFLVLLFTNITFYLTPVVYEEKMIPEAYRTLIYLNPLAPLMMGWRQLLLRGELATTNIGFAWIEGLLILGIGFLFYKRLEWKFAEFV